MERRREGANLSVVIPALNAAETLAGTLAALGEAEGADLVLEVVVVDGGSADGTADLARRAGARVVAAPRGRGIQLAAGAQVAAGEWLLFVHADTRLGAGWRRAVARFVADPANLCRAAAFRFALDDPAEAARRLERIVGWRCRLLGLPYGDQGLLVSRTFYEELGGYAPLPLMEDVDLVRRIGRRRLARLDVAAVTSAARYRRGGYVVRSSRNLLCLALFLLGLPVHLVARLYGAG